MSIFQVPRKDEERRQVIIGVIDCSGSMEPSWPWLVDHWNRCVPRENLLTITFDSKTSKVPNNQLNVDILEHGGGGTKIVEAFELLEAELAAIPKEVHVTVLFISDGEDNDAKSLEQRFGTPLCARHAIETGLVLQHLERGEEGIEHDLLRHDPDRTLRVARAAIDVEAPDLSRAAGLHDEPGEDVD